MRDFLADLCEIRLCEMWVGGLLLVVVRLERLLARRLLGLWRGLLGLRVCRRTRVGVLTLEIENSEEFRAKRVVINEGLMQCGEHLFVACLEVGEMVGDVVAHCSEDLCLLFEGTRSRFDAREELRQLICFFVAEKNDHIRFFLFTERGKALPKTFRASILLPTQLI